MYNRLSEALLEDICHPVSAVVSIGADGQILAVHLVDTGYCGERMRIAKEAEEIWLLSHHDDGSTVPWPDDACNLSRVLALARGRRVRVFLTSEYSGCREIGLSGEEWDVL